MYNLIKSIKSLLRELWQGISKGVRKALPLYKGKYGEEEILSVPVPKKYEIDSVEAFQAKASKVLFVGRNLPLFGHSNERQG